MEVLYIFGSSQAGDYSHLAELVTLVVRKGPNVQENFCLFIKRARTTVQRILFCVVSYFLVHVLYTATEPASQYEGGVRLVGGQYPSEGILEVFVYGMWYTLCTSSISSAAANAVCHQLGYTENIGISSRYVTV